MCLYLATPVRWAVWQTFVLTPPPLARREPGSVALSEEEMYYDPVFLSRRGVASHRVPAVRLRRTLDDPPYALFPLSRREVGDVWTGAVPCAAWDVESVPGWETALVDFAPEVGYPLELLQLFLDVLRTQKFPDGAVVSFEAWTEACCQPVEMLTIMYPWRRVFRPSSFCCPRTA